MWDIKTAVVPINAHLFEVYAENFAYQLFKVL